MFEVAGSYEAVLQRLRAELGERVGVSFQSPTSEARRVYLNVKRPGGLEVVGRIFVQENLAGPTTVEVFEKVPPGLFDGISRWWRRVTFVPPAR